MTNREFVHDVALLAIGAVFGWQVSHWFGIVPAVAILFLLAAVVGVAIQAAYWVDVNRGKR